MKKLMLGTMLFAATPAYADPDRVSIIFGSYHLNSSYDFEEVNPGIFLTWEQRTFDYSVGIYNNSYGRESIAATASLPVVEWETGEISVFFGAALYPEDGRRFAVHVGDVVPVGGIQVRQGNLFGQLIPSDGAATSAILSLGATFPLDF